MDRRTVLTALVGTAGAGTALALSRSQIMRQPASERRTALAQPEQRLTTAGSGSSFSIAQVPIGAGGFVTGLDISADGSRMVCRTDVANAYVRDSTDAFWRPLFTPSSLQKTDLDRLPEVKDKVDSRGVAAIRLAPSNRDVIYASYLGHIWRSVDGGRRVQRTNLPQKRMLSNTGAQRLFNPTIAIHPLNPDAVVVGTWGDGVWSTTDGGNKWEAVQVPPSGNWDGDQAGINLVTYAAGRSERLYVFVTGVGLFHAPNGTVDRLLQASGGPTHCSNMVPSPDGGVFLCEQTSDYRGKVWRFHPQRGWTSAQPDREGLALALDPLQPGRAILIEANGFIMESTDHCASFRTHGVGKFSSTGNEIAWMGGLKQFYPAEAHFDPKMRDRVWIAQGVGVASLDGPSRATLNDRSAGIEELCATSVVCVPGGKTFFSAWDKPFWRVDSLSSFTNDFRFPLKAGNNHSADLVAFSSSLDFAPEDPDFLIGVVAPSDNSGPGFTDDGGQSWQIFSGTPAEGWGYGGTIAAASKTNFVLLPSNNGVGQYTLDGGRSWSPIRLDGTNPTGRFSNAYFIARKNLTADKTRPGVFALVYTTIRNDQYAEPLGGFWLTLDGGRTWRQQLQGVVGPKPTDPEANLRQQKDPRQFWQCQLDFIPGHARELVYTPHSDFKNDRLYWSPDDGRTWSELHKSIRNVGCFAFGRPAPGATRPTFLFWGEVRERRGLYASFDWFRSEPQIVTSYPVQNLAEVVCMGGDPDRYGRFYLGTDCAGWVRIDVQA